MKKFGCVLSQNHLSAVIFSFLVHVLYEQRKVHIYILWGRVFVRRWNAVDGSPEEQLIISLRKYERVKLVSRGCQMQLIQLSVVKLDRLSIFKEWEQNLVYVNRVDL